MVKRGVDRAPHFASLPFSLTKCFGLIGLDTKTPRSLCPTAQRRATYINNHGELCGCEAAEIDQVPSRIQSEGRHAKGQCRGDEEVSTTNFQAGQKDEADSSARRWIAGKIAEILKNDDDVVIELCYNLMEGSRFVRFLLQFKYQPLLTVYSPTSRRCRFN